MLGFNCRQNNTKTKNFCISARYSLHVYLRIDTCKLQKLRSPPVIFQNGFTRNCKYLGNFYDETRSNKQSNTLNVCDDSYASAHLAAIAQSINQLINQ